MAKTATINIRIEPDIKIQAEELFSSFGITVSDAVNMFIRKSLMEGGLPFAVRQPRFNDETEAAIAEGRKILSGKRSVKRYHSAEELFEDEGLTHEV